MKNNKLIPFEVMTINLLSKTRERNLIPFEGIVRMFEQFIKGEGVRGDMTITGNIYSYEIFVDLCQTYRGLCKKVNMEAIESTAIVNLTHAFFEFLDYLQNPRKVTYYDKSMTEITIHHNPNEQ